MMKRFRQFSAASIFTFLVAMSPDVAWSDQNTDINGLLAQINQAYKTNDVVSGLRASEQLEAYGRTLSGKQSDAVLATALHHEGLFLSRAGRFKEAIPKLEESLSLASRDGKPEFVLDISTHLIAADVALGRFEEAAPLAAKVLAFCTQTFGPDSTYTRGALIDHGTIAYQRQHYQEALASFERAVAIFAKADQPTSEPVKFADALDKLSGTYKQLNRFEDAERALKQGLDLLNGDLRTNGSGASTYQNLLNSTANLYRQLGRYPEAIAVYQQLISLTQAKLGENHPLVGARIANLGLVYYSMGVYEKAEPLAKQSLSITEKAYGPDSPLTANVLGNLANIYTGQGKLDGALAIYQRILPIYEKSYGPDSIQVALTLTNIGASYSSMGRLAEAKDSTLRALAIVDKKLGPDSLDSIKLLGNLSGQSQALGQTQEAESYLLHAFNIQETKFGPDHPDLVLMLQNLASYDRNRRAYDKAAMKLDRALAIAQLRFGPQSRNVIGVLGDLSTLAQRQDDLPKALAYLRRASEIASQLQKRGRNDPLISHVDWALLVALWEQEERAKTAGKMISDEAFSAAQRLQETQASTALAQMSLRFSAGDSALSKEIRQKQDLIATREQLEKRLTNELGAPNGKRSDEAINQLRNEISQNQTTLDDVSVHLTNDFPQYAQLADPAPLSVKQAQALLKPEEALVTFTVLHDDSYVFMITKDAAEWRKIPLGQKEMDGAVTNLRKGLWNDKPGEAPSPFDVFAAHKLYKALLGPVEGLMAGKSKLLVVPGGALTSLPFQVLITKEPAPGLSPQEADRQAVWMIKDKAITTLPAISSLRALRQFARISKATKPFIGFGDPILQRNQPTAKSGERVASRGVQPVASYYRGAAINLDALRQGLAPLPETADELRAVAKVLGAGETDVHLRDDATLAKLEKTSLDQFKVIDFATHGLVAGEIGGLAEPALVLTLPEKPTADDNGLLTASRVAKLNLDADWAVLSACNTAAGDAQGAEGLSGLARAFFYAGARSLLVSHWPVDSDAAVKLTTGAFSALAKDPSIGRAEAMRRSMLALIADKDRPDNADPSVWAPFALVGEGN